LTAKPEIIQEAGYGREFQVHRDCPVPYGTGVVVSF